jgi:long-subunit acyl-CoA synthetase (AMP-forming)
MSRSFDDPHADSVLFSFLQNINGVPRTMQYYHMGDYKWITFGQYQQSITDFSSGLASLGLNAGNKLAIFEETRNEWTVAAQAAFRLSASILTVYANLGEEALAYALNLAEVEYLVANGSTFSMLAKIVPQVPSLKTIVYIDAVDDKVKANIEMIPGRNIRVISYEAVIKLGQEHPVPEKPPKPDDVAVIMFTSGTTGLPKGVVLTHRQVVAAIAAGFVVLDKAVHLDSSDVYLSYLPLAHILAFVVHYVAFYLGAHIGYGVRLHFVSFRVNASVIAVILTVELVLIILIQSPRTVGASLCVLTIMIICCRELFVLTIPTLMCVLSLACAIAMVISRPSSPPYSLVYPL